MKLASMPAQAPHTDSYRLEAEPAPPARWTSARLLRSAATKAAFLAEQTRVVSYPNSGRTWLRVMLADLGVRPRFTHGRSRFRLALSASGLAEGIADVSHRRVLFLIRDPRDTVISNYYQVTERGKRWQGDFSTFLRHPNYGFERILVFHSAWLSSRQFFRAGFHVERYEAMRADTPAALRRIAAFLRVPMVSEREFRAVAEANSFEAMKRREETGELFALHGDRFSPVDAGAGERKVRKGKVGGFREALEPQDLAWCEELMARHGYEEMLRRLAPMHDA